MGRGGTTMYPFERFSEQGKRALTLAQEEAERSRHSYIGTEHLLLGVLRVDDGLAATILHKLGVEETSLRERIKSSLGRSERIIIQQIIPTSRVKKVVEISFEEARRMGCSYVGTEHLLLGMLVEGEGIAAHVLRDLHVTRERVQAEIALLRNGGAEEAPGDADAAEPRLPPPGGERGVPRLAQDATDLLRYAGMLASAEESPAVGLDHVQRALADPAVRGMLQLAARIRQAVAAREEAVARRDYDAAKESRAEEMRLRDELARAQAAWRAGLRQPPPA